jgi:hypothetical protein
MPKILNPNPANTLCQNLYLSDKLLLLITVYSELLMSDDLLQGASTNTSNLGAERYISNVDPKAARITELEQRLGKAEMQLKFAFHAVDRCRANQRLLAWASGTAVAIVVANVVVTVAQQ